MASLQQDLERGHEMSQANVPNQPSTPVPMRGIHPRDMPRSFSPTMSHYQSGLQQNLDSPILAAFRYHVGIFNDPSLVAAPMRTQPQIRPQAQDGPRSRSMGDVVSTLAGTLSSSNTAVSTTGFVRPVSNLGIYSRVVAAEQKYHREYRIFAILINGALGLQIIFAAALTALGAGNGPHKAITAFGALNTVLAGLLTFLKGSGLPNRLKYYENEYTKLREYIEQRERDFSSDAHQGRIGWDELAEEISIIEQKYEVVRKDIEANTPDSYVSMSNAIKAMNTTHSNNNNNGSNNQSTGIYDSTAGNNNQPPMTGLAGKLSRLNSTLSQHHEDGRHTAKDLDGRIRSGVTDFEHRINKGWNDLEKQAKVNVREVVDESSDRVRDAGKQAEYRISSVQYNVGDGIRRAHSAADSRLHDAENRMYDAQNTARSNLYNAQNSMQSGMYNVQNAANSTIHDAQDGFYTAQNATSSAAHDAQTAAQQGYFNAQDVARSTISNAQNTALNTVHDAQASTQSRYDEERHHAQAKANEMENKIMTVAEKTAEKVLQMTKNRH